MKNTRMGQKLIKGLKEVLEFEQGRKTLNVSEVNLPQMPPGWTQKQIIRLRTERLGVSQPLFASYLGVSVGALRSWEQGLKHPSSTARRLLQVLSKDPERFIRLIKDLRVPAKKVS